MSFAHLFPDVDYRHHLSVKRGGVADFFASTGDHASILAERRHWLAESAETYAAAEHSTAESIDETADLLQLSAALSTSSSALEKIIDLGGAIEPDIVLLHKTADTTFRVVAGCVCFPSSWSFPEKMGLPLQEIHSVVPELNSAIGVPIARFLDKLQPGAAWERSNWGLSASPERNQHPMRNLARLRSPVSAESIWVRAEDQILTILPRTKTLLFGIRIVSRTIADLRRSEPDAAAGLHRALLTMTEAMARYKNIGAVRTELIGLLT